MNLLHLLALLGLFVVWMTYKIYTGFKTNIAKARATGYPVLITPIYPLNHLWLTIRPLADPLLTTLLPSFLYERWIFIMTAEWEYHPSPSAHFSRIGSDTFIAASWDGLACFTSDPSVIHQVMSRREAFPKDTRQYGILEMFGANVVTTEGETWRWHRKVTSASFNERNAGFTFREGVRQTRGLLGEWFNTKGGDGEEKTGAAGEEGKEMEETKTITTLERDTMRWALNIIGYVGFGLKLLWPHESMPRDVDPKLAKYGELTPPEGYTMTFADSLATVLERIVILLLVPSAVLKRYPVSWKWGKKVREAWEAKVNYTKYMNAFLAEKREDIQAGRKEKEGMNIMGQLVRSKYDSSSATEKQDASAWKMEDSDITGNAFIMTLAGHETTANVTHFTLVELAIHPEAQRLVQRDIDSLLGRDSDPETWDYEKSINALLASYIGAVINETLRLIPPVVTTPKRVTETDQSVVDKETGERHLMPALMPVMPIITAAQRNKKYWPAVDKTKQGPAGDLDEWLPARWFLSCQGQTSAEEEQEEETFGGYTGADTSPTLFRPVRGSFVPFSDGARSCLGRRIAMVEMVAAIAVLFQRYSVELAVDEWASDEEVKRMSKEERREVYKKAQKKAEETLTTAKSVLTLKLTGGRNVPVRFVKRGRERFVGDEGL